MILTSKDETLPAAFRRFTADPNPSGLTLTIRDGEPSSPGTVHTYHLSRSEGLALAAQLVPAAVQAGDGSNLD